MKTNYPESGKYIIAVSGGVDSMALLDVLSAHSSYELIVAHFNHGIRPDARRDEELVTAAAKRYGLSIEIGRAWLGAGASEAEARRVRYRFLNSVKEAHKAAAIITAHHQDDLIETALLNILRGTGPRGMAALAANREVIRPFLDCAKEEIKSYAVAHKLIWNEDSTNQDDRYLRNYLRLRVIPRLSAEQRTSLIKNINSIISNTKEQDEEIADLASRLFEDNYMRRSDFAVLPNQVANELLAFWLRSSGFRDFNRSTLSRANVLIRTGPAGSRHNLNKSVDLVLTKSTAQLKTIA